MMDLTAYLLAGPWRIGRVLVALRGGPQAVRRLVADAREPDPSLLPHDDRVLAWLGAERRTGRRLVLATAAGERRARAIADHLGLFDEVLASGDVQLTAERRRARLAQRYGSGGYDYAGSDRADLAVWADAGVAHVVGGSYGLLHQARALAPLGAVIPRDGARLRALSRALRPHQWLKNLLVFVAMFTAQDVGRLRYWWHSWLMFVAFCLVASSVHVLNDRSDLDSDRSHPTKRERPFASGRGSMVCGWALLPVLLAAGIALSAVPLPPKATLMLLACLSITVAYTFWLKRVEIVDVITLSGLYTIRIVAGAEAISAHLTIWLLTFSVFLVTSLGIVKRVSELSRARRAGREVRGRGYSHQDLELMTSLGVTSGCAVVFVLYVNDNATARPHANPHLLWAAIPALLYWISRLWLLAGRGEIDEDPLLFAAGDRISLLVAAFVAASFLAAKFIA